MIKGIQARQRDFTENFIHKEIEWIKNSRSKNNIYDYFDEYDIGWELLSKYLGKEYSLVNSIDAAGYAMYRIRKNS
jgi:hypothetical protein